MYCVYLLSDNGRGSYLSVKGKHEWKTFRTARKHARDIQAVINKGRNIFNAVAVEVQNEFGEIFSH